MAHLLSRARVCLFGRFLSNKICGPFRSYTIDIFVGEMNVSGVILSKTFFTKDSILTMSTKGEHTIKQSAAFSSPVSTLYASALGSMTHLLATKTKWLAFY